MIYKDMSTELPVVEAEKEPAIIVNEKFGVTIQGEGAGIGKPCFFLRLHHCPVKCPSCDSHFTWSGVEQGAKETLQDLTNWLDAGLIKYPGAGLVVSGGEPLIHFRNPQFRAWLAWYSSRASKCQWVSLETSGFIGPKALEGEKLQGLGLFLACFNSVHLSPKVTPCLHGEGWSDEELLVNIPAILDLYAQNLGRFNPRTLALKFVVRDEADIEVVVQAEERFQFKARGHEVYLMPWGIHSANIIEACKQLVPVCAKYGFILTPRLHSIMYGPKRGV